MHHEETMRAEHHRGHHDEWPERGCPICQFLRGDTRRAIAISKAQQRIIAALDEIDTDIGLCDSCDDSATELLDERVGKTHLTVLEAFEDLRREIVHG